MTGPVPEDPAASGGRSPGPDHDARAVADPPDASAGTEPDHGPDVRLGEVPDAETDADEATALRTGRPSRSSAGTDGDARAGTDGDGPGHPDHEPGATHDGTESRHGMRAALSTVTTRMMAERAVRATEARPPRRRRARRRPGRRGRQGARRRASPTTRRSSGASSAASAC